jgi:inosine-uridine nucleoside N-ribohydrolase
MNLVDRGRLPPEFVVVSVDGPNADNQAAAWGAMRAFDNDRIKLAAIIISGTCVDYRIGAPLGSRDDQISREVQEMHTARMAGLFARAGSAVPVFIGMPVEQTAITTPIPHETHVFHDEYDIFGDKNGFGAQAIKGNFDDSLELIENLPGKVHVAGGGPFTEIAEFLKHDRIKQKLGNLAVQSGVELSERAIYSKIAFNHEVDEHASLKTFLHYPGKTLYVPSDITRAKAATFKSAETIKRLGVHKEIAEIFKVHRQHAEERHDKRQMELERQGKPTKGYPALSVHDLQAVMALQQSLGMGNGIFTFDKIDADHAIENMIKASALSERDSGRPAVITPEVVANAGYVGAGQTTQGPVAERFVVTAQDTARYKRHAIRLLR